MTRRRLAGLTLPALSVIGFIALWQIVVELRGIPPIYLPAPSAIAKALSQMALDGTLWINLAVTVLRSPRASPSPPFAASRSACSWAGRTSWRRSPIRGSPHFIRCRKSR